MHRPTVIRISDPRSRKSSIPSFSGACRVATTDPILYRHEDRRQAGADAGASPPIGVNMDGLNTNGETHASYLIMLSRVVFF